MIEQIKSSLLVLREKKPLVLCLTNYVTMDFMANSLLALGAAPLMSESIEELEELVSISQALYINIGTLNSVFMERAIFAAKIANSLNKPVILDPVGSGASKLRTSAALQLLPLANIVRGNASEIISLSGANGSTKGVESMHPVEKAMTVANSLAKDLGKIIVISGPKDFITDGNQTQTLPFGSNIMPLITGMGCTMTAVISAFTANNSNLFQAATYATAYFGLCGQLAHHQSEVPGFFRQEFINNLFHPDWTYFVDAFTHMRD
ncbi:hydroxyethylthiazole kinase [Legionella maioricensis]|uniref:Hydroxyethylthiazole kinase n=1 Tax=Legionella maioricensis TaxID=2896528 RepID=A0A9X2CZN4_9GAMM|nr:hydroxyethylthiazole kinase [Legionella maioricensis]MCL9686792.1 hydroxyethylthiazole kinase [Legionella maioricensis]